MRDSSAMADAREALRGWFDVEPVELRPLGEGHIHSTWRVALPSHDGSGVRRYVLQKINQAVFARPAELMANLDQLFVNRSASLNYELPQPIASLSGALLVSAGTQTLPNGDVVENQWRLSVFIEQSQTLQVLSDTQQAAAAGRAFGEFQSWLEGLAQTPLAEVIPGFHQVEGYVQALARASSSSITEDNPFAARERSLLEQVRARNYLPRAQSGVAQRNRADSCLIHGDCKVNNLLFAEDAQRVVAILDLDTLMRGPWWLDFGDLIRSATCTDAGEFQREFYPALAEGFFAGRAGNADSGRLADFDLADALRAPAHMTFMLSVRFLTDHLCGDSYFTAEQRGDNLQRAERQFRLLKTLESEDTVGFMRDVLSRFL